MNNIFKLTETQAEENIDNNMKKIQYRDNNIIFFDNGTNTENIKFILDSYLDINNYYRVC